MLNQQEDWRAIPDYDGFYSVSSLGRIKSEARIIADSRGVIRNIQERIIAPGVLKNGYQSFVAHKDGGGETMYVHRAVAAAFIGPRPPRLDTMHRNDVETDNRAANLRYGSRSENQLDAVAARGQ